MKVKKEQVSRILSRIDGKYIEEAAVPAPGNGTGVSRPRRVRWKAAAVCAALAAVLGSAAFAYAAEAREYRSAVTFFEENGLSMQGLSRSEVKAVYRDITENRFSYGRTADVIRKAAPGWEIEQAAPSPDELSELWDRNFGAGTGARASDGAAYRVFHIDYDYVYDERKGFEVLEKSVLECSRDGAMLWTAEFTDFFLQSWTQIGAGTAVWGFSESRTLGEPSYGWIACVDDEGNILWQLRLDHGFRHEIVAAVLDNGDGTWAVFSRGDGKHLCLSCIGADGTERRFRQTEVGNLGIWNAARLGDGYIVQLGNLTSRDTALLYRMDREGNVLDSYSYEADDCDYYLTDMIAYGGQIYLSAYAVPKQNDEGGRHEIADILDAVFSEGRLDISGEELTPLVRANYTAVLLLCDPDGGVPQTFYSVKGSLGGRLSVNEAGELEWDAESIVSTFFSPATSAFTVGGTCRVFRYTFDEAGVLTGRTDTGETVPYWR